MNVNKVLTKDYENKTLGEHGKNKANSKPNKANSKPICRMLKMNVNKVLTKDYGNKSNWALFENKPNTNPIKPNFRGKKMLLRLTINGRRKSFGSRTLLRAFSSGSLSNKLRMGK